jgi:hypothetical protein
MISATESDFIRNNACVPEHTTGYVTAISGGEPHLFGSYLCYITRGSLVFVGYPLGEPFDEKRMKRVLSDAEKRLKPEEIALIAPVVSLKNDAIVEKTSDHYYRLDVHALRVPPKTLNMIRRAAREITIEKARKYSDEHIELVNDFLDSHPANTGAQFIFQHIGDYVASSDTALVINGRDRSGRLAAFDIAEFGAKDYAFYMFNFVSRRYYIPGISDALLYEIVKMAREQVKKYVNLGLGINKGIVFFKLKWGGIPFMPYEYVLYRRTKNTILESLLQKL